MKFEDKLAPYTGEAYDTEGWVTGLPTGVTVTYSCETDMTEIGKHTVTAHFSGDYENYEAIADMTATLTIENNYALPEFAEDTLYYNPAGNTFEILNFEGIKDIVKLTINGENISDIAEALTQTEIGEYTLVITLTDGKFLGDSQSVTLTFNIVKRVVALPEYNGSLVYSGKSQTPMAEDFVYDGLGCYFVSAESGLNAGTYNARFVLTDTEYYEWASASTRRAVRYALTDGELNGGEIQVPWTIAKATVSATAEDGKMPAFTCATVSDLSKYITYTYYKDELCTESVAFADLQPDTRYYVKATFTDEDGNFELDDSALGVISGTASYDTAPKEPSFIQKAFAYVKEHWLWFAIGAGVLLFLIILIIIIAATSKKRKEKAEERKAEKKEEERQRRAEEREERMMRMQMGGQMPITAAGMLAAQQAQAQTQPQPQPVQQQAPAQAQ
ncbi:MAG: hypothetical protein K2J83_03735, partial [Clostridia bacterium]|nr:hypothetical protein [Clostridia bacterium]